MKGLLSAALLTLASVSLHAEDTINLSVPPDLRLSAPLFNYSEMPPPFAYGQPDQLGIYLGAMLQPVVLPLDDASFLDKGDGWAVVVGFSPDVMYDPEGIIGLEMVFSLSTHTDPSTGNEVDYTRLLFGFKWWDNSRPEIMPYLTLGTAFHSIDNNPGGTELDGWAFYAGGGVDVFLTPNFSLGVDIKVHVWAADDMFGMVFYGLTPEIGAEVALHF